MMPPARFRKICARLHRPMPTSRHCGHWYFGISIMKPDDTPLVTVRRSTSAATNAPTMPITYSPSITSPCNPTNGSTCVLGMNAPMISV